MIYYGTSNTETIWFGRENDHEEVHYIEMHQLNNEPVFYVTACCNDDWVWAFHADVHSNYEMIKFAIMEAAFESCCISNLLDTLDEIFTEEYADLVVEDGDCECDECCESCNHRGCLN